MKLQLALLCSVLCLGASTYGQTIVLSKESGLIVSQTTCTVITVGTTLTFVRSSDCDADVLISEPLSVEQLLITGDSIFTYTFNEIGEYVAFCDVSAAAIATSAACVIVEAEAIPVLSDWGLIIFALLILIFVLNTSSIKSINLQKG